MWKKQKNDLHNQIHTLISGMLIGILGSLTGAMSAYGGWIQPEAGRWAYEFEDGHLASGWFRDTDGSWYRMGEDGLMLAHQWYQDTDGSWYRMGESGSMLAHQWYQDIDGKWYYLSQSGAMFVSGVTPDGYTVDAGGVWDGGAAVQLSGVSSGSRGGGSSSGGGGGGYGSGSSSSSGAYGSDSSSGGGAGGHGGGSLNSDGNGSGLSGSYGKENDNGSISDESNGSAENGNGTVEDDDGEKGDRGDVGGDKQDGVLDAEQSLLAWYELAKQAESEITKEASEQIENRRFLAADQTEINLRLATIAGRIMDLQEEDFWEVYVIGKNIVPNGTILKTIFRDNIQYSHLKLDMVVVGNNVYHISKFIIVRTSNEIPVEKEEAIEGYWNIGDWVTHEIDGESYTFRCIDEDYMDLQNPEKKAALFLCDSVIPADWKSVYVPQQNEDGIFEYEFIAGPIVNFGRSHDYKYSAIRSWLNENDDDFQDAMKINTGVSYAYRGSTEEGMFEAFDAENLTSVYIGKQNMRDSLFVLSVDEALTYRDYLWCFDGESEENADSQISMFCKGYWLRTPAQMQDSDDNEQIYIVDLVNGNLHPMSIVPENMEETEDEELMVTTEIGVRPAFVMEQKYLTGYEEDEM